MSGTGPAPEGTDPHRDPSLGQGDHRFRFDWGPMGLRRLAPDAAVVVVVDVLSFTTAVDVALGAGATVVPHRWADGSAGERARAEGARLAEPRGVAGDGRLSLSPTSLASLPAGTRVVLPSPNGSALCHGAVEAGARRVLAACLRNAAAVGRELAEGDGPVAVIAAGERWRGATGPLRPAVEDLLGAGAVLVAAVGVDTAACSPEALAAVAVWQAMGATPGPLLADCASGRQLVARGYAEDVRTAARVDVSDQVPELVDGAFAPR